MKTIRENHRLAAHRRGFSFAEVMFAVVILGIGFIMVSAIFPVAVEQTRSTADDAAASQLARSMIQLITSQLSSDDFFSDPALVGVTQEFSGIGSRWDRISGSLISATDPRYACVPFFCTSTNGTVRITLLIVRRRSNAAYTSADLIARGAGEPNLAPKSISITSITHQADGTDAVVIKRAGSFGSDQAISAGSFIIISNFNESQANGDPVSNARTFRVAAQQSETDTTVTWTLDPTNRLEPGESFEPSGSLPITAFIVGRDLTDPTQDASSTNPYAGPAQDVAVYTTFIQPH